MTFDWLLLLRFFHLFFAFTYVGSLMVVEWNARAARRSFDWRERAVLFRTIFNSSTVAGLGGLLLVGIVGNVMSTAMGYSMRSDSWIRWVNTLWLIATVLLGAIGLPAAASLARMAGQMIEAEEGAQPPAAFARTFLRWRLVNVAQSLLYLGMLVLMVFRWRG